MSKYFGLRNVCGTIFASCVRLNEQTRTDKQPTINTYLQRTIGAVESTRTLKEAFQFPTCRLPGGTAS